MALDPTLLARMALGVDAGTVYVDSLKDAVIGLSEDAVGAAYNRARQSLLAHGIQICELHHNRKANPNNGPVGVNDVFGSTWLTSGAGSVIQLTGDPGDPVIKFRHVKLPANEVGPWHLHHDPDKGWMEVIRFDFEKAANNAGVHGLTAKDAAKELYETSRPTDAQCKKAQRQLDKLVKRGVLARVDGHRGGDGGSRPTTWYAVGLASKDAQDELSGQSNQQQLTMNV
jgi:replicative DNA helicase